MDGQILGRHLLVEFYGCAADILNEVDFIQEKMSEAATEAGAVVIDKIFRKFQPQGVSGMIMIEESHLSIHTWPEYGYAAVDLFTCGDRVDPHRGFELLKRALHSDQYEVREIKRGLRSEMEMVEQIIITPSVESFHDHP